jgi:hypothetical protein
MPQTDAPRLAWNRTPSGAVRLHVHHLSDTVGRFDLEAVDRELCADPAFVAEGHCAVTLAKYPDLRMIVVSMRKGAHVGDASAFARLTVQTLRGHAVLHHAEGTLHLQRGYLATLDHGMTLDLEALEDCAVLLTLAWTGEAPAVIA